MSLIKAISPWLILIAALLIVNFYAPLYHYLFKTMEAAVNIIPGAPVKIRPFWNAYFWVLISAIVSFIILRPTGEQLKFTLTKWFKRAPKPVVSTAVFFAIGLLMNNTGMVTVQGVRKIVDPMMLH